MNRTLLFALLLLPGLAQAVICKTVGPDGVVSFTNLPGSECPQGSKVPGYEQPAAPTERAGAVDTGVRARQVKFAGYESIGIVSPEDGGTIRNNEGRVLVLVQLEPSLQQSHFITAYLDGKAYKGRYGSSQIQLARVARGTHSLYVKVTDSKGKTLIKSESITFTLHSTHVSITVNPITGDDYVNKYDPGTVPVRGMYEGVSGAGVYLRFPATGLVTKLVPVGETKEIKYTIIAPDGEEKLVTETYNWEIPVPRELLTAEASFQAVAKIIPDPARPENAFEFGTSSTHSVDPELFKGFADDRWQGDDLADFYRKNEEFFEADEFTEFKPSPSTPNETNPVFDTGTMSTPGEINPAFNPGTMSTPGQINPAYSNPAAKN